MKLPSIKRSEVPADERIPRGAIIVVAIGLLATILAAVLSNTGSNSGEAAHLEFVQKAKIPDSKPVNVPGSKNLKMQLVGGTIKATGTNVAGYSLYRVLSTVKIDKDARIGGEMLCSMHGLGTGTLVAQSSGGLRMLYPRSSEQGVSGQEIPETVLAKFASHGHLLAVLEEVTEDMPESFTTIQGVKVGWPEYEEGTEHILYHLPHGKAPATVELPFYTVWKSKKRPAAQIACTLETKLGKATVETEGSLPHVSPPIDEEAEEVKQEEREAEEGEGTEGGEGE
ncbi:MAG: hypothetical protein JST59_27295 [Actinobacteria bacterium]|nr:hypothetical protein [Actinomycetota bacterium]